MARRSKAKLVHPEIRALYERMFREDRHTLDEIQDAGRELADRLGVPPSTLPSRSGLHRYSQPLLELTERMRAQDSAARAIVSELGENPDDRAGALLVQAVTTAMTDVALRANESAETSIDDVRKLARAAKDTIAARGASLKERQAIESAARERVLREQREKLEALGKSGAVDPAVLATVIKAAYDL